MEEALSGIPGYSSTIMQNFTPIGGTDAEICPRTKNRREQKYGKLNKLAFRGY